MQSLQKSEREKEREREKGKEGEREGEREGGGLSIRSARMEKKESTTVDQHTVDGTLQ